MFKIIKKEIQWGNKTLTIETGHLARQANASVLVTLGNTTVLCTVVHGQKAKTDPFLPLTVNYQEKAYAVGKVPGGFNKREGRPSESEILTSRLIDRPIRPLFPKGYFFETQVNAILLSLDTEVLPSIVAMIGVSAALNLTNIPWAGPIGACRVGYDESGFILNPSKAQLEDSHLDLVMAGTKEGVLMVESEAQELKEETMLKAVMFGHQHIQPVIQQIELLKEEFLANVEHSNQNYQSVNLLDMSSVDNIKQFFQDHVQQKIEESFAIKDKLQRKSTLDDIYQQVLEDYKEQLPEDTDLEILEKLDFYAKIAFDRLSADVIRNKILSTKQRIDGRGLQDVRPIETQVAMLPMVHGSALFTRGETQVLSVVTLGTTQDEQIMDSLTGEYREHFLLHYNFPSFSVGETGRNMGPGRREIGHGKLAWRAIHPELPSHDDFTYTIRIVSEVLESNGSSSMATVCSASMALMDAGVPMKNAVAGVAMGLIKDGDQVAILTDILGDEDHLGDMDFKVAGTAEGITSLQMDIKITSITEPIMQEALQQALQARLHILNIMNKTINQHSETLSQFAPKIINLTISKDKIRDIIGPGGKMIRMITEETGAKIDIDDSGVVKVSSPNEETAQKAVDWIQSIVEDPKVNKIYEGIVVNIVDFGAFVRFMHNKEGLVHISAIIPSRVAKVSDILKMGQKVYVKCLAVDEKGKIRLSMKEVNQDTGEMLS